MKAEGKGLLRFAGILEIISAGIGIGLMLSAQKDFTMMQNLLNYTQIGIQLLAGIVALLFAGKPKHYRICFFFVILLAMIIVGNFANSLHSTSAITSQIAAAIIPLIYYWGTIKNKKSL